MTSETTESPKLTSFVTKMIGHQRTMASGLADVAKGMEEIAAGYEALQLDVAQIRAEALRWAADRIDPGPRESDDPTVTVADADRGTAANLRLWADQIQQGRISTAGERDRLEAEVERMRRERDGMLRLIGDLADGDGCWFDHHGGCQAHGYLSLEPGEKCPQQEAKELLEAANGGEQR